MFEWLQSWIPESAGSARDLLQCGPGFSGQLCSAVMAQQRAILAPLPHAGGHGGPQITVDAPANNLGARWRAGYWLFVGSRIARGRGQVAAAEGLAAAGLTEVNQAAKLTMQRSTYTWFEDPSGTRKIRSTLRAAEQKLRQAGIEDVANILSLQQQRKAINTQQDATAGQGALSILPVSGSALAKLPAATAITTASIVGVVLLVGGIWSIWPWLSPLIGIGRGALRTRRSKKQRNRKRRRSRR